MSYTKKFESFSNSDKVPDSINQFFAITAYTFSIEFKSKLIFVYDDGESTKISI